MRTRRLSTGILFVVGTAGCRLFSTSHGPQAQPPIAYLQKRAYDERSNAKKP